MLFFSIYIRLANLQQTEEYLVFKDLEKLFAYATISK